MKKGQNPIFAMLPDSVLRRLYELSKTSHKGELLEQTVGRSVIPLAIAVAFIFVAQSLNVTAFKIVASRVFATFGDGATTWVSWASLAVWLIGLVALVRLLFSWLEMISLRKTNPLFDFKSESLSINRLSTWVPVALFVIGPFAFSAWFDVGFFVLSIPILIIGLVVFHVFVDA